MFIDIERLRAGKFDENLLLSVRMAKNFIIVLTPNALDRCIGDDDKTDWVHKVQMKCLCLLVIKALPFVIMLTTFHKTIL